MTAHIKCHVRATSGSAPLTKNGQERRPLRFFTICTKNQVLKLNIDKVMLILRRKCPLQETPPVGPRPAARAGAASPPDGSTY